MHLKNKNKTAQVQQIQRRKTNLNKNKINLVFIRLYYTTADQICTTSIIQEAIHTNVSHLQCRQRDHYYQRVTNVIVIVAEYVFLHVAETIHSLF